MSHESFPTIQDEVNVVRFTSEIVLTTGVEQGWADPVDPREVDFTQRPSFMGEIDFDQEGRPLNPNRTPDMPGDRGDLGKWGPNNAADPVVMANGKILLIRRKDTKQWALPGGMVDPGERVSLTARRELLEESGVDLGVMDGIVIYEGYVDDPRNTRNAWMETTARLFKLGFNPDPKAGDDAAEAKWFKCPDMNTLIAETQKHDREQGLEVQDLYASHGSIISRALEIIPSVSTEPVYFQRGYKSILDDDGNTIIYEPNGEHWMRETNYGLIYDGPWDLIGHYNE